MILTLDDEILIDAAQRIIRTRYRPGLHVVSAALRTESGKIVTGVHLEAFVGRIAVCAEAIALGRAVTEFGTSRFTTIVAVRHPDPASETREIGVVAPCGMCRELIADYSSQADVIVPRNGTLARVKIGDLLPDKYNAGGAGGFGT